MYKKELKYITIEYSEKDLSYIDSLCEYIEQSCNEIISFLGILKFGKKVNVKLWDNLEEFRSYYKKIAYNSDENYEVPEWICGFAYDNIVHTLCLEEYKKTQSHENKNLEDLKYLVMHEFTHGCHSKLNNKCAAKWLTEGLANTITHQREKDDRIFNFTLEQAINGGPDYRNYHTMFCYVYETYGREYILSLIKDNELLKKETPRLYAETVKMYGDTSNK